MSGEFNEGYDAEYVMARCLDVPCYIAWISGEPLSTIPCHLKDGGVSLVAEEVRLRMIPLDAAEMDNLPPEDIFRAVYDRALERTPGPRD